jgi:tetratricopeptide (TPR) repeat protein
MLGLQASRIALASIWETSGSLPELREALAADPAEPGIRHELGAACLYQFEGSRPQEGLEFLREAADSAPNRGPYWVDLALACESAGDVSCAQASLGRALELNPMRPRVHWLAANYYVQTNQTRKGLSELRRLLDLSPAYSESAFGLCLHLQLSAEAVDQEVLPDAKKPGIQLNYADFLGAKGDVVAAARLWEMVLASGQAFSFGQAEPYVHRLEQGGQYSQAFKAWQDLERLRVIEGPESPDEQIFNGGFEQLPLNAGFDWHYGEPTYWALSFADPGAYEGRRCLRLEFTVRRNAEYEPVYEIVPVTPNQVYLLTAQTRSEGITSDSGPRVRVVDAEQPGDFAASTEPTVGTTGWHAVHATFSTKSSTRFIRLSIWRPRGRSFPSEIQGTFWVDAVSLKPAPQGPSVKP